MTAIRHKGAENRASLLANGWPEHPHNQRYFTLNPYGRVLTAFVKGKGFWMHLAGDSRVAWGKDYDVALISLVELAENSR